MFLAELNGLKLWNTDIQSAYLNAYNTEPVLIVAGPKFGEKREGHVLIICKALYAETSELNLKSYQAHEWQDTESKSFLYRTASPEKMKKEKIFCSSAGSLPRASGKRWSKKWGSQ